MSKLTPPDLARCQAEWTEREWMRLGGRPRRVRCEALPVAVVRETEPGPDGLRGSMSLCPACLEVFLRSKAPGYADVEEIER